MKKIIKSIKSIKSVAVALVVLIALILATCTAGAQPLGSLPVSFIGQSGPGYGQWNSNGVTLTITNADPGFTNLLGTTVAGSTLTYYTTNMFSDWVAAITNWAYGTNDGIIPLKPGRYATVTLKGQIMTNGTALTLGPSGVITLKFAGGDNLSPGGPADFESVPTWSYSFSVPTNYIYNTLNVSNLVYWQWTTNVEVDALASWQLFSMSTTSTNTALTNPIVRVRLNQ